MNWFSTVSVMGLGLVLGLKHALDADHLAAVSTIVSERKGLLRSSMVGAVWGVGHTLSLLFAGMAVMFLHVEIGPRTALALEFAVALMLIGLGANLLGKVLRGGTVHAHVHAHGGYVHAHPHLHAGVVEAAPHTHHGLRLEVRPLLVGMVHGLAGSAALMLLVLSTIPSACLGFLYIGIFGAGSIGGMLCMSALVALPAHLMVERFQRVQVTVQALAACFSLGLGLFMAYEIGRASGWLA